MTRKMNNNKKNKSLPHQFLWRTFHGTDAVASIGEG